MPDDQNALARSLFIAALDVPEEERDSWLDEKCGKDSDLRREIKSLLNTIRRDDDPLERGIGNAVADAIQNDIRNVHDGLQLRCPHCQSKVELSDDPDQTEVICPACEETISFSADESSDQSESQPIRIAHFELEEKLGSGTFGTVWRALDTELERTVAIKLPRYGLLTSDETQRFLTEAKAAASLRHPNIVSVYEVGQHEQTPYIATEFIDGSSLADWMNKRNPTPTQAAQMCATIAGALQHAHENGIIHRDLKPANVLLDEKDDPHVADFGLAKRISQDATLTKDGAIMGTPSFMSPEQARGEGRNADARTDIWSLGVILFRLLTGEVPFRGETNRVIQQILNEDPPGLRTLSSQVPRDLETICLKCLESAPARRYQTANDLQQDLENYLEGRPINARPTTSIERAWRWCKRKPSIAILASLLFVCLVAGATISTFYAVKADRRADDLAESKSELEKTLQAKDEALAERKKALVDAMATMDGYVETIRNDEVLKEPRFKDLRNQLLQEAAEHYWDSIQILTNEDQRALLAERFGILTKISISLGSLEEAETAARKQISILETLVNENPESIEFRIQLSEAHLNLGSVLTMLEQYASNDSEFEKAANLLRTVVKDVPENVDAKKSLARTLIGLGLRKSDTIEYREAADYFSEALRTLNGLPEEELSRLGNADAKVRATLRLGFCELNLRQIERGSTHLREALELAEKMVKSAPKIANAHRLRAEVGRVYGRWFPGISSEERVAIFRSAVSHAEKAHALKPYDVDIKRWLIVCYGSLGNQLLIEKKFEEAKNELQIGKEYADAFLNENYEVSGFANDIYMVYQNLGIAQRNQESMDGLEEAIAGHEFVGEKYGEILKSNPQSNAVKNAVAQNYHQLGVLYRKQENYKKAIDNYEKSLEHRRVLFDLSPRNYVIRRNITRTLSNLGNALIDDGQAAEAVKKYQTAIETEKETLNILKANGQGTGEGFLGQLHLNALPACRLSKQSDLYTFHSKQFIQIMDRLKIKGLEAYLNNFALNHARVQEVKDPKLAIELATRVCELSGFKNATYLETLSIANEADGNYEEAIKWLKEAISLTPTDEKKKFQKRLDELLAKAKDEKSD